jgi:hypothetical protein
MTQSLTRQKRYRNTSDNYKEGKMTNSKVVVEVLGGVAYVVSAPAGIDVEIIDLDNAEGEDDD